MKNKKYNSLIQTKKLDLTVGGMLDQNNYANLFDVVNKGEKSYFNLCKNISFKNLDYLSTELYTIYEVLANDTWPGIYIKFIIQ